MAGGMDMGNPQKGGKKPLDTTINLVPFIDLMAVTICFLIMTAVWTQIGRLQVASMGNSSDPTDVKEPDKTLPLTVLITEKDIRVTAGTENLPPITLRRDEKNQLILTDLQASLKKIKDQLPDQNQMTLQAEDNVRYEDLVRVVDEAIGDGIPNVSVSPVNS